MKECVICSNKIKFFDTSFNIKDGPVCTTCLWKLRYESSTSLSENARIMAELEKITKDEYIERINISEKIKNDKEQIVVTHKGGRLSIDELNQKFFFNGFSNPDNNSIHSFNELIGYEIIEDGSTITKGSLGNAIVGGVLFGGVGAIVGGITGEKKKSELLRNFKIKLELDNMDTPIEYVGYWEVSPNKTEPLTKNSPVYTTIKEMIAKDSALLELILRKVEQNKGINLNNNQINTEKNSPQERLEKLKQLFENGLITENEFNIKREEIIKSI